MKLEPSKKRETGRNNKRRRTSSSAPASSRRIEKTSVNAKSKRSRKKKSPKQSDTIAPFVVPSNEGRRAAFYLRVSTDEQSTANQLPDLKRFAKARDLVLYQHYEETVSAGARRTELERMLDGAHAGLFDVLVIWALDRLSRKMTEVLDIMRKLDAAGVRVVSVRESWLDMSGPTRDLLLAVFGWVAQQERARLVERTQAGLARARAQGVKLGRPRKHVPGLRELVRDNYSNEWIAKRLGVSRATVVRLKKGIRETTH